MKRLFEEESGQGLVEYAVIIAAASVAVIGSLLMFRGALTGVFTRINQKIGSVMS